MGYAMREIQPQERLREREILLILFLSRIIPDAQTGKAMFAKTTPAFDTDKVRWQPANLSLGDVLVIGYI